MANGYLTSCAFIISIILSIIFFVKKGIPNKETKIFEKMLVVNILESLATTSIVIVALTNNSIFLFKILNRIDVILIILWCSLMFYYIYIISTRKYNINVKKIICIFNFFSFFLSLFLNVNIINNNGVLDSNGALTIFGLLGSIVYIIMMIIILIFMEKSDSLNRQKYLPLYFLIILLIFVAVLRVIIPRVNFISIVLSIVDMIMMFTIENPDVKMIEELEIAKNQAEKANHAKTDFLSSMSHEIRTPLNAIVGFSECVLSSNTLEEAKENSADIINASKTLLEIVNGILDISKIESGKLEIINSSYKAKELLESVATLVRPRMEEKGLDFQISISDDIPEILYGDHSNLKKIVTNLLSNASKYTEHGFVKYSVSCINNNNICRLIITVEDSGRGIKEENISKLFTKFQRLDEDRNTTIEGTGLGLAITKKLLELMGGKIVVQSRYGEGSKFTAIVDQKIEIIKNLNTAPVEVVTKSKDVSGKKVLIVDDKINSGSIYDMILMDDMMPKMSGVETLNELKKQSNFTTPVIALTANAISGMKEKYISCGFNDYLAKPINKTELETIVYKYLNTTGSTKTNIDFGALPKEVYQIGSKGGLIVPDNPDNKENSNNSSITVDVSNDKEQILKDNDIDYQKGIELLGDISMYQETMKDFLNGINDRMSNLEKYQNDMANYAIEVHALKSDAKYLGFTKLAEIAYDQELRSKENNQQYIISNYSQLKEEVSRVCDVCKKYLSTI